MNRLPFLKSRHQNCLIFLTLHVLRRKSEFAQCRELYIVRKRSQTHEKTRCKVKVKKWLSRRACVQLIRLHLPCDFSYFFYNSSSCFLKTLIAKNTVHPIYTHIYILIICFIKPRKIGYPNVLLFCEQKRQEALNALTDSLSCL